MNIAVTKEVIQTSSFVVDNLPAMQEIVNQVDPDTYSLYVLFVVSFLMNIMKVDKESNSIKKMVNFASYPLFLISASLIAIDFLNVTDEISDLQILTILSAAIIGFLIGFVKNPHFGENGVMEMSKTDSI